MQADSKDTQLHYAEHSRDELLQEVANKEQQVAKLHAEVSWLILLNQSLVEVDVELCNRVKRCNRSCLQWKASQNNWLNASSK